MSAILEYVNVRANSCWFVVVKFDYFYIYLYATQTEPIRMYLLRKIASGRGVKRDKLGPSKKLMSGKAVRKPVENIKQHRKMSIISLNLHRKTSIVRTVR